MPEGSISSAKILWQRSLQVVLPMSCLLCAQEGNTYLCAACCARLLEPAVQRPALPPLLGVWSVGDAQDPAWSLLLHTYKYRLVRGLSRPLANFLIPQLRVWQQTQQRLVLVPVPLHARRERERGFNQSRELARQAAARLQLRVWDGLQRQRYTSPQVKRGAAERWENLRDSMLPRGRVPLASATYILIDDVATTGATLHAAAGALHNAGAKRIYALTLAAAI